MTIKAVVFDGLGTCLDWCSTIVASLPSSIPEDVRVDFALEWRQRIFETYSLLASADGPMPTTDAIYRDTLRDKLRAFSNIADALDEEDPHHHGLIEAWSQLTTWDDVAAELQVIREDLGLEVYVSANGSTRGMLDQMRFAGLKFDMMFSSELVGAFKPGVHAERRVLETLELKPEETVMVASHVDSLKGAKMLGMRTVYVYRFEDDIGQEQEAREDHDVYLEGMAGLAEEIGKWMQRGAGEANGSVASMMMD